MPDTDKGILAIMQPIEKVEDCLSYSDTIYNHMKKLWPYEKVASQFMYGHHLEPTLTFDVCNNIGEVLCDDGMLKVNVQSDFFTHEPLSQTVNLQFTCPYESFTSDFIHDTVLKYLGVEPDIVVFGKKLKELALGPINMKVRGVLLRIEPSDEFGDDCVRVTCLFVDHYGLTR